MISVMFLNQLVGPILFRKTLILLGEAKVKDPGRSRENEDDDGGGGSSTLESRAVRV